MDYATMVSSDKNHNNNQPMIHHTVSIFTIREPALNPYTVKYDNGTR